MLIGQVTYLEFLLIFLQLSLSNLKWKAPRNSPRTSIFLFQVEFIPLLQLQKMEEEGRERMREELEARRELLLKRRDVNLERKANLDGIKRNQGLTKPWVFSYYVHWPRETYQR